MFSDDPYGPNDGLNREETASVFDPSFSLASRPSGGGGGGRAGTSFSAHRSSRVSGTSTNEDLVLERRFGLRNEQVREFGMLETFSFAMTIISVSSCVASTLDTPLLLGGPASVVWCWGVGAVFNLSIAISISELISAYPTCGGLYSASAWLVPKKYRAIVGWCCGYLNTIGQVAGVASTEFALSSMIWAGVRIAKDGDFVVTHAHQYGLYAGLLVCHGILNSLPTSQLATMTRSFVFINVGSALMIPLMLIFLTPVGQMNSPEWVFTEVQNGTNYPDSLAFMLGLLSVMWTMTDYDAVAHISFEVKQAAMAAPAALTVAVAATGVLGLVLNIVLLFASPPLDQLPGVSGLAFLEILHIRIGKAGALLLWTLVCSSAGMCVHVALHANSRSVFQVSRDRLLPDRGLFGRLSPVTRTPLWAVWSLIVFSLLLGALHFVSQPAVNAVFAMCAVALDLSYVVPVACRRIFANHEDVMYRPGPYSVGEPWSLIANVIMLSWTTFACVILCVPTVWPITAKTFNYSWVMTLGVMAASLAWYFLQAHKIYTGPLRDIPSPSATRTSFSDPFPARHGQTYFSQQFRNRFPSRGSVAGHAADPPLIAVHPGSEASTSPRLAGEPSSPAMAVSDSQDSPLEMTPVTPHSFPP